MNTSPLFTIRQSKKLGLVPVISAALALATAGIVGRTAGTKKDVHQALGMDTVHRIATPNEIKKALTEEGISQAMRDRCESVDSQEELARTPFGDLVKMKDAVVEGRGEDPKKVQMICQAVGSSFGAVLVFLTKDGVLVEQNPL